MAAPWSGPTLRDHDLQERFDRDDPTAKRLHGRVQAGAQIVEYGYADRSPSHDREDHLVPL